MNRKYFKTIFVFAFLLFLPFMTMTPVKVQALTLSEYALLNQLYTTLIQAALNQANSLTPINGPGEYPFENAIFDTCNPAEKILASGTVVITRSEEMDEDDNAVTNIIEIQINAKGVSQLNGDKAKIKVREVFKLPDGFFLGTNSDTDDFKIKLIFKTIWQGKRVDITNSVLIAIDKDGHLINQTVNECVGN